MAIAGESTDQRLGIVLYHFQIIYLTLIEYALMAQILFKPSASASHTRTSVGEQQIKNNWSKLQL